MSKHPYHEWLDTLPFTATPLSAVCQYHDTFNEEWAYNADQMLLTYKDKKSYFDLGKGAYGFACLSAYECFRPVLRSVLPEQQLEQLRSYVFSDSFDRPVQGFFNSDRLLPLSLDELDYITMHEYDKRPFFYKAGQTVSINRNKFMTVSWADKADYKIILPTQLDYCFFPESATTWRPPAESRGITSGVQAASVPEFSSVEDLFL